jgi:transposase
MEACGTAHYWGRELTSLGHQVKLMHAAYVKPYVKHGKNDEVDAEVIDAVMASGRHTEDQYTDSESVKSKFA